MVRVNIGSATYIANGPKRAQKMKWDQNPPKDKGTPTKKNHGMSPRSNASIMKTWDTLPRIAKR
jgi:hypothetical protein